LFLAGLFQPSLMPESEVESTLVEPYPLCRILGLPTKIRLVWEGRSGIQHNDTRQKDIQHNDIQYNDIQHNDIQHNDIQHNDIQLNGLYCETQHRIYSA
jgi:hypothetical protein